MEKGPELEVYSALRGVFFFLSFFFFGELMICFFDISVFDEFCIYILGVPFRSKLLRTFY